jgi:hypothetical protein
VLNGYLVVDGDNSITGKENSLGSTAHKYLKKVKIKIRILKNGLK